MRMTSLLLLAGAGLLLAGCSADDPMSPVAQAADYALPAAGQGLQSDLPPSDPLVRTPGGLEAETQVAIGPADPVYIRPAVPAPPPVPVVTAGPFRMRDWARGETFYAHGRVCHMPRWFEDPYDNIVYYREPFGTSCRDVRAAGCSAGRFLVNLAALPVTMVCHSLCCERACTDRTAVFLRTPEGIEIVPAAAE